MLFADKRKLESGLKVNLNALREKELDYYVRLPHTQPSFLALPAIRYAIFSHCHRCKTAARLG